MGTSKQRKHKRIDLDKSIIVVWQRGPHRETTRAMTLGVGGLFIATKKPAPVGTMLQLLLEAPGGGKNIHATALVRDSRPAKGMGVEFVAMTPEEKSRLEEALRKVYGGEVSAAPEEAAKRRFPRINLPKGIQVAWKSERLSQMATVQTLSVGGLFIATDKPLPVGSTVRLLFQVPGGEILATAVVRDSKPGKGMGIEFQELNTQQRGWLEGLMKRLLG